MRWIPVTERLPEGADAISCEAWCAAEEPGEVAGPCIMGYDADADEGDRWASREDTGCWEPGPVTHWRSRPVAPGQEDTMGVIDGMGVKHHLFTTRAEEDAAVARSPLKVAQDLMALAECVGAAIPLGVDVPLTEREEAKRARPPCDEEPWVVADDEGLRLRFRTEDAAWRYRNEYTDRLVNPTVTYEPATAGVPGTQEPKETGNA